MNSEHLRQLSDKSYEDKMKTLIFQSKERELKRQQTYKEMKDNPEKIIKILDEKAEKVYSNLEKVAKKGCRVARIDSYGEYYGDDFHKVDGTHENTPCQQFKLWAERQNKLKKYGVDIKFNYVTHEDIYDDLGHLMPDARSDIPGCNLSFQW